jgi:hypothetical protein
MKKNLNFLNDRRSEAIGKLRRDANLRYYRNDLSGALPLGELESLALPFETYRLAFTPELLERIYGDRINNTKIPISI